MQGTFIGGRAPTPIQAYLNPDGSISYNGKVYVARQSGGSVGNPNYFQSGGAGGSGCVCSGGVCNNCNIG